MTLEPEEEEVGSSIAELAKQCRQKLQTCTLIPPLMHFEWAENRLAEFKLWAANTGAFAGERASLDARLAIEWHTTNLITSILILLMGCVEKCQAAVETTDVEDEGMVETHESNLAAESEDNNDEPDIIPRSFSPWSDTSSSESDDGEESIDLSPHSPNTTELKKAQIEVEQVIDHLTRLAFAIRKSGANSRFQKADRLFRKEAHEDFYRHLAVVILARGSRDGREPDFAVDLKTLSPIQDRLITANLQRRNRFLYMQRHSQKLAIEAPQFRSAFSVPVFDNPVLLRPDETVDVEKDGEDTGTVALEENFNTNIDVQARLAIMTATSASAVGTSIERIPDRISAPTPSQVAKTTITSISAKMEYPRPPKLQGGLRFFQCPCCCQTLPSMFREPSQWKKHLSEDISPYTCIIQDCSKPGSLYTSRDAWLQHVQKDHSQCWECLPCSKPGYKPLVFPSVDAFLNHAKNAHGDSISEDQYNMLVKNSARPAPFGINRCPLCDETDVADSDLLLEHIVEHVHSFSLRSLPWPMDDVEDGDESNAMDYFKDHDFFDTSSDGKSYKDNSFDDESDRGSAWLGSLPSNATPSPIASEAGAENDDDDPSSPGIDKTHLSNTAFMERLGKITGNFMGDDDKSVFPEVVSGPQRCPEGVVLGDKTVLWPPPSLPLRRWMQIRPLNLRIMAAETFSESVPNNDLPPAWTHKWVIPGDVVDVAPQQTFELPAIAAHSTLEFIETDLRDGAYSIRRIPSSLSDVVARPVSVAGRSGQGAGSQNQGESRVRKMLRNILGRRPKQEKHKIYKS